MGSADGEEPGRLLELGGQQARPAMTAGRRRAAGIYGAIIVPRLRRRPSILSGSRPRAPTVFTTSSEMDCRPDYRNGAYNFPFSRLKVNWR